MTRQSKPYSGYKSFQYPEPGVDYKPFRLAREVGRVASYAVPMRPEQERTVQEVLDEELVISLHDHPFVTPEDAAEIFEYNRQGRQWTGYEGLSISRIDVIFDNSMDGTALITSNAGWKWTDIIPDIGMRYSDIAHQEMVFVAATVDDLLRAKREGKIALVPSLEAATPIENEIDRVDVLYGLGIRCMGIAYSEANSLGAELREARDRGGRQSSTTLPPARREIKIPVYVTTSPVAGTPMNSPGGDPLPCGGQITAPRILDRHPQAEGMAPAIRFLAHGLGLSLPEEPFIAAHTDTLL